jgi:thiol-disulfide isomerase/thioredoxin
MTAVRRSPIAARLVVATALVLGSLAGCEKTASSTADPPGNDLLRKAAAIIEDQKTLKLAVDADLKIEAQGQKQEIKSTYSLAIARPDRLALLMKSGEYGITLVTDGKQFLRGVAALKQYVVGDAPSSLSEVFSDRSAMFLGMGVGEDLFKALVSDHPYEQLMAGVTDQRDLGIEKMDGRDCRHLHFDKDAYQWDAWIETGARPLISKVEFRPKNLPGMGGEKEGSVKVSLTYGLSDWQFDPPLTESDFAFQPPADWQKVENLFGAGPGGDAEPPPSPLLGKAAPDFQLEKLGGGKAGVAEHREKDVVILDFWATWCGPCRAALPTIIKVAAKYRDRGVVFYAVDIGETPEDVDKFLTEEKLELPVIFDREGDVSNLYLVKGIPQTVLIGKNGTVQVVHVGLSNDLEKRLSHELEELLAGKDLAAETIEAFEKTQTDAEGIELAWSHPGSWSGTAEPAEEAIAFALGQDGKLITMNPQGDELAAATIEDDRATLLRAANLVADKSAELLAFSAWGPTVKAHASDGKLLWSYADGEGVDDVCGADLDGNGLDDVVIGYNGGTGLHVLDHTGKLLWKDSTIGNVWHVTAGNVDGDARPEVITTSATGQVHIFDAAGKHLRDLEPGVYGYMVRTCPSVGEDKSLETIIVAGQGKKSEEVVALDAQGNQLWSVALPARVESAATCRLKPWVAVATGDGSVRVIDVGTGQEIGHAAGQGPRAEVGWLSPPEGDPLLVVATGGGLKAYTILGGKPE